VKKSWFSLKSLSEEENLSGVLRAIGDRGSGKTTYMAALARWPYTNPASPVETVTALNKDGEYLIQQAQKKLEEGLPLAPTPLKNDVLEMKDYSLRIVLKKPVSQKKLNLDISCKDYPGEFFSDLLRDNIGEPLRQNVLQNYLDDCVLATGILLLLDGNAHQKDGDYALGIDKLRVAFDRSQREQQKRRIALVLTKCELADLSINRDKPKTLNQARFPKVCQKLEVWQSSGAVSVEYFTASAFGMLGTNCPTGNSRQTNRDREGVASVIQYPKQWRPFGLVSPIYWLCTGKRHPQLDSE
jgi:GTPase SAR1 family protein